MLSQIRNWYMEPPNSPVNLVLFFFQLHIGTFSPIPDFCSSGLTFAASFLLISHRYGHPCYWLEIPTIRAR